VPTGASALEFIPLHGKGRKAARIFLWLKPSGTNGLRWGCGVFFRDARMVKSADTADLKSADPYQVVGVQVPLRAPT
jgi:hypothetical protein